VNEEYVEKIAKFAGTLEVEEPVGYLLVVSDKMKMLGGGELKRLGGIDRVDLANYVIRCLRIRPKDLAAWRQIRQEDHIMEKLVHGLEALGGNLDD